jgi:hypothetical protein
MAFNQHDLTPIGIRIDATGFADLLRDLEKAPQEVKDATTKEIHAIGGKLYDKAKENLSGGVLQVQTGRLKGSWVEARHPLYWEAQSDVFYGAIHEAGNYPWLAPAFEQLGGEDAVIAAVRKGLDSGLKGAGL